MTTRRSITLICDRCSAEYGPLSWLSKAGSKPVTMKTLIGHARRYGWRIVNEAGRKTGGSKRFDFCGDSICQAAADDVPQRLSEMRKAEAALTKAKARIANLKGRQR